MRLSARFKAGIMAAFGDVLNVSDAGGWILRALGGGKTKAGVPVSEWTAVNMPVVWGCITLISDAVAQLPCDVFRRTERGREPLEGHPVTALLNVSANDEMGSSIIRGAMQMHALLWGNGYGEIEWNGRGVPVGIWPLFPDRTFPDVRFDELGVRSLRYRTSIADRQWSLPANRVLHVKGQTYDGICGLSPVMVARQAIGLGLAMEEFGAKFFANDARSGGFLMHPGKLGDKAVTNIQDSYSADGQGGLENAFKVKVLEEGMKYLPTTIPPEDAQFLGSRGFQIAEIARIYRVPLVLLQSVEGSTVWGTGIEQLLIGFVKWTLDPWLVRWEEEISRKLLTPAERAAGIFVRFNRNALLRGDMAARALFYKAGIVDGWMTRNEVRTKEDMNPLDGLDEPLVPRNMGPSGQVDQETRTDAP